MYDHVVKDYAIFHLAVFSFVTSVNRFMLKVENDRIRSKISVLDKNKLIQQSLYYIEI